MDNSKDPRIRIMPKKYQPQFGAAISALLEGKKATAGIDSEIESEPKTLDVSLKQEGSSRQEQITTGQLQQGNQLTVRYLPLQTITTSRFQAREIISEQEVEELAASIKSKGIIQPLVVRELEEGNAPPNGKLYELIAGERRWRAAGLAGLIEVPAIVRIFSDREALEVAIIENAQREDLNPIEEAQAIRRLIDEFGVSQTEVAQVIGKNRATISNSLRLLVLTPEVLELLKSGELSAGHGRALLSVKDPKLQLKLAQKTLQRELSVRMLEEIIGRLNGRATRGKAAEASESASLQRWKTKIQGTLNIEKVNLRLDPQGRRRLQITFESEASWKRFLDRMR